MEFTRQGVGFELFLSENEDRKESTVASGIMMSGGGGRAIE